MKAKAGEPPESWWRGRNPTRKILETFEEKPVRTVGGGGEAQQNQQNQDEGGGRSHLHHLQLQRGSCHYGGHFLSQCIFIACDAEHAACERGSRGGSDPTAKEDTLTFIKVYQILKRKHLFSVHFCHSRGPKLCTWEPRTQKMVALHPLRVPNPAHWGPTPPCPWPQINSVIEGFLFS